MATLSELETALKKAHAAGNANHARAIIAEIRRMSTETDTPEFKTGVGDVIRATGQGLSFGFGDELAAIARSAVGGKTYEEAVAEERAKLEAFRSGNAPLAYGLEIAGSIPSMFVPALAAARAPKLAALGGKVGSKLGAAGAAAATGAAQGALYGAGTASSEEGKTLEGAVGGGLLGGALGGTLGVALPKATETAKKFISEGVPLTIGQSRGGAIKAIEDLTEFLPFIGRSVSAAKGRALDEYSRVPINAVIQKVGGEPLPKGATGNFAVDHMNSQVKKAYKDVKPELTLSKSKSEVLPAVKKSMKALSKGQIPDVFITKESAKLAQKFVDDEIIPRLNKNVVQGEDWFQLDKMLNKKINKTFKSTASTDADRGMAEALSIVQREFRRASKEVNLSGVSKYETIDNVYPLVASIKRAAGGKAAGLADGSFTPDELVGAMATKQKPKFEIGAAIGQREAVEAAEALGKRQDAALRPYLEGSRLAGGVGLSVGGSMGLLNPLIAGTLAAVPAYSRAGVPIARTFGGGVADFAREKLPAIAGGAAGGYIGEPVMGLLGQE